MNRFQKYVFGFITCRIKSKNCQRFFNICNAQNIHLFNINSTEQDTYFVVTISDFKKIKSAAHKSHSIPHIIKKFGLPFILHNHKHKFVFFISLIISIFILYYLSTFIWNIEYYGNLKYTDDTLNHVLNELHVSSGIKKSKIDTNTLEEELRLKYDDISWISATINGTVLKIYIKEALVTNAEEAKHETGNLVADVDCIIESIVTRTGTPKIMQGQYVQAGDTLISGEVVLYNDDQTIKEEHFVHADGDIYGRFTYKCNEYYPKKFIDKSQNHKTNYGITVTLFNKQIQIGKTRINSENCIQTQETIHYRLTPNFYLPFKLCIYSNNYYAPQIQYFSDEQVLNMGKENINQIISNLQNNNAIIHKNNLKIHIEEDYYLISGDIEISAPVGKFIPCQ